MADYGVKITKEGKDIYSTEPRDYVFNSKYGSVKIAMQSPNKTYETVTVNAGSNATVTVAHNLGFIPMVMLFTELKPGSGHWYMGGIPVSDPTDRSGAVATINNTGTYVDDTNLVIKYYNDTGGNLTVKYYYFIFADNG